MCVYIWALMYMYLLIYMFFSVLITDLDNTVCPYLVSVMHPHVVGKPSSPLTLIWLRSWAKAESVCFFRCFPYGPGPESRVSAGSVCLAWELELRVILVTRGWGPFLSQLDLDLFIPTPVDSKTNKQIIQPKWNINHCLWAVMQVSFPLCYQLEARFVQMAFECQTWKQCCIF